MKKVYKILIVCFLFFSCNNADDLRNDNIKSFCSTENPTENLAWLKDEINEREQNITQFSKYDYIVQSTHDGETIIIYANCNPLVNSVLPVYNCEGEFVAIIGSRNQDIPFEVLSAGQIIWKTKDNVCDF